MVMVTPRLFHSVFSRTCLHRIRGGLSLSFWLALPPFSSTVTAQRELPGASDAADCPHSEERRALLALPHAAAWPGNGARQHEATAVTHGQQGVAACLAIVTVWTEPVEHHLGRSLSLRRGQSRPQSNSTLVEAAGMAGKGGKSGAYMTPAVLLGPLGIWISGGASGHRPGPVIQLSIKSASLSSPTAAPGAPLPLLLAHLQVGGI